MKIAIRCLIPRVLLLDQKSFPMYLSWCEAVWSGTCKQSLWIPLVRKVNFLYFSLSGSGSLLVFVPAYVQKKAATNEEYNDRSQRIISVRVHWRNLCNKSARKESLKKKTHWIQDFKNNKVCVCFSALQCTVQWPHRPARSHFQLVTPRLVTAARGKGPVHFAEEELSLYGLPPCECGRGFPNGPVSDLHLL